MAFLAPIVGVAAGSAGATAAGVAVAGTAASVAGAGVAAYGSYQQGQAAKKAGAYNYAVAQNNATIQQQQGQQQAAILANQAQWQQYNQRIQENQAVAKRQEAESLRTTTEENLKRRRDDYRRILSRQRAQFAKAGVVMSGTPLAVLSESAARMELDAQDVVNKTRNALESYYYQAELMEAGAQAQGADVYMTQWRGQQALTQSKYQAAQTRSQGQMNLMSSNGAVRNANLQAGTSLLSGIGSAGFGYYNATKGIG